MFAFIDRTTYRSLISTNLKNERRRQAFREEVADIRHQHAALRSQIKRLAQVQKNLLEVL